MHITLVSALYPPDVAAPAPYTKELARRLSAAHAVTVLTYGHAPELIPGVRICHVRKDRYALVRLVQFSYYLLQLGRTTDRLIIGNAPSTELPILLAGLLYQRKIYIHHTDPKIVYRGWRRVLHQLACRLSTATLATPLPPARPEIHPLDPYPHAAFTTYESAWETHLRELTTQLV